MKIDKDQITGMVLLTLLFGVYFFFFAPDPETESAAPETVVTEQAAASEADATISEGTAESSAKPNLPDSVLKLQYGALYEAFQGESKEVTLENKDIKVILDTKGGKVKSVLLKNYVTYTKEPLWLIDEKSSQIQENIETSNGKVNLNTLFYAAETKGNAVVFRSESGDSYIERTYSLAEEGFQLQYRTKFKGLEGVVTSDAVVFEWSNNLKRVEKSIEQTRTRSTVNIFGEEDWFENISETSNDDEELVFEKPAKWFSSKQKFFSAALITEARMNNVVARTAVNEQDTSYIKYTKINASIPFSTLSDESSNLRYYFGPNDYDICETVAESFERNVYLGWAFLSSINLYLVIPLFKVLEGLTSNYGVIILILVLIVKMLLFPLTYKSYISMAKMKVLKPEMDELKKKFGDDMQKIQQETMKLYGQVGVNPLSGCIPVVAQMPVFIAMFNFFPNAIQLRQVSFLWADDLSTYDSVLDLPFEIPFYGDHVSLFTILMTVTTLIYTYINNQMNTATTQESMKVVSYFTPVMFMFFLNNFSSGLTYYYFVSNLITITQQLMIRRFVDESKIRKVLDENKKRIAAGGGKKSRFQQAMDDAMKQRQQKKKK